MYLIEIFLPLADNAGGPFPPSLFDSVRKTLTAAFGGLTAFQRSPAEGTEKKGGHERSDQLIVLEVMAHTVDPRWWADYRKHLEATGSDPNQGVSRYPSLTGPSRCLTEDIEPRRASTAFDYARRRVPCFSSALYSTWADAHRGSLHAHARARNSRGQR